jgi:nitrogen regulatory protein PII
MKLLILITSRITNGLDVALAWQEAGAPGITIIRAHGLQSLRQEIQGGHLELPRMVVSMASAMASIIHNVEEKSEVVLSVVPDELVDGLVDATTSVLGDLLLPDNGVLFVLDVERAVGVRDHRPQK